MNEKTYYAPLPTFLVFLFFVVLGIFLSAIDTNYPKIVTYLLIAALLIFGVIRFSYRIKVSDGKLYELGFFSKGKIMPIDSITKINWEKEYFWSDDGFYGNSVRRRYHIQSPDQTLPKYTISKRLVADLLKVRPEIEVVKGGVIF